LNRNEFRDKLTLNDQQHKEMFNNLSNWINDKTAYLKKKESVPSSRDARAQLDVLENYAGDKKEMTETDAAQFHKLTAHILGAKYNGKHSEYSWPKSDEIKSRDAHVVSEWNHLDQLFGDKVRFCFFIFAFALT
jgi:hypothetical protein